MAVVSGVGGGVLAIDAGKTGSRIARYEGDRRVTMGRGPGIDNIAAPDAFPSIMASLEDALAQLPAAARRAERVGAGLTGVFPPSPHAARLALAVGRLVGARRVTVASDVVTTYCGALGLGPGAVVAAGTGAIALAVGADGTHARTDGWGYHLGDGGSGYLIGRQGLDSALRAHDGRGGSPLLRRLAQERFGPLDALPDIVYGAANPARVVAGFALQVAEAARAGDQVARELWVGAARELATTVVGAVQRVAAEDAPVELSWNGGVFAAGALVVEPFLHAVRARLPNVRPVPPRGDALCGARMIAEAEGPVVVASLLEVVEMTAP